jgi:hypothetical protein
LEREVGIRPLTPAGTELAIWAAPCALIVSDPPLPVLAVHSHPRFPPGFLTHGWK